MAFTPQLFSNYTFPIDLTEFMENTMLGHQEINNFTPVLDNVGSLDLIVSQDWDTMSSAWMIPNFSEQLGSATISEYLPAISDCQMGFYSGAIEGSQNFSGGFQSPQIGEFEEDSKPPAYPNAATENWQGIQGNQMAAGEEPNIKVERYSEEERKERILRYLKKRNQRNFNKTIKYACRKTLADRRVRVRGRFARNNNELSDEDMARKKHENHKQDFHCDDSIQCQLKDDDDWLQEAMASVVYLSHSSPDDI